MVAAPDDLSWAGRGRPGEVELNSSSNPSRTRTRAARVDAVPAPTPSSPATNDATDPAGSTTPRKKRPPVVALLAVLLPLVGLSVAAIVSGSSSDDGASTATTLVQDGDAEATTTAGAAPATDGAPTTTASNEDGPAAETDGGSTEGDDAAPADEVASRPQDAGGEGDRPTVTYPQPTVPSGGCATSSGTAVITLRSTPSPACLRLSPDQPVVVRNQTGKDISVVAIGLNENVAAGSEVRVGRAADAFGDGQSTFWSPGNPQLSGIVQVG